MTAKQPIALAALTAFAISATAAFAQAPQVPSLPTLPKAPSAPTPVTPTLPGTQAPALGQSTVNCPDGTVRSLQGSDVAGALSSGKPSAAGAASAVGAAPAVKPSIGDAATRIVPATKPYGAAMAGAPQVKVPSTQAAAADPCANIDPLKPLEPIR